MLARTSAAHAALLPDTLIKLACQKNAGINDPCTAVYDVGGDGKRHAFPNDKVYFTWHADFSGVQTVSAATLAAIPLGQNVTYRPGSKLVKFTTLDKVYAVALGGTLRWVTTEDVAQGIYGPTWNKDVDDIPDTFFSDYQMGADISSATGYSTTVEASYAPDIDADLPSTSKATSVVTDRGTFAIQLITLQKGRFDMITDTAETSDCANNCPAKSLADYATESDATIGIHGSYFCPPDYADCAGKTNTFLTPVFNSAAHVMLNASSLAVHEGPMIAETTAGQYFFFHRTKDFGTSVSAFESANGATLAAALANYPSLVEGGQVVVLTEPKLDSDMQTVKAVRGAIGMNDRFIYLAIAKSATVVDLASIMKTLGATDAFNLDGGGSAALYYNGAYAYGPGRLLPTAILFKQK